MLYNIHLYRSKKILVCTVGEGAILKDAMIKLVVILADNKWFIKYVIPQQGDVNIITSYQLVVLN